MITSNYKTCTKDNTKLKISHTGSTDMCNKYKDLVCIKYKELLQTVILNIPTEKNLAKTLSGNHKIGNFRQINIRKCAQPHILKVQIKTTMKYTSHLPKLK